MIHKEQEILLKIREIIQDCARQNEQLLEDQHQVSHIELKLFLATARFLVNHIEILHQAKQTSLLNFQQQARTLPALNIAKKDKSPFEDLSDHDADHERIEDPSRRDETKINYNIEALLSKKNQHQPAFIVHSGAELKPNMGQPTDPSSLPKIDSERRSNETISAEKQPITIAPQSSISLNDKWLFIKELFNNSVDAYNEAVSLLSKYETFKEAEHFLEQNYGAKNQWHAKIQTLEKFYTIIARRFSRQ